MQFPNSTDITQLSNDFANADVTLRCLIASEIYEAVTDGDRTTDAITWTSVSEGQLLNILRELHSLGYSVTLGSSTITIVWQ